jgi:hypothetical protein
VRVHGVRGGPRTDLLKVSIAYTDGYKAVGTLVYAWPDAVEKAQAADRVLRERLDRLGLRFDEVLTEYVGWNACHGPLAGDIPRDLPEVTVRWGVRGPGSRGGGALHQGARAAGARRPPFGDRLRRRPAGSAGDHGVLARAGAARRDRARAEGGGADGVRVPAGPIVRHKR